MLYLMRNPEAGSNSKDFSNPQEGLAPDVSSTPIEGHIQFLDVRFAYPLHLSKGVLNGLSFDARPREMCALCGPSGSGKSTAFGLLLRLYDPSSGAITIDGMDLKNLQVCVATCVTLNL